MGWLFCLCDSLKIAKKSRLIQCISKLVFCNSLHDAILMIGSLGGWSWALIHICVCSAPAQVLHPSEPGADALWRVDSAVAQLFRSQSAAAPALRSLRIPRGCVSLLHWCQDRGHHAQGTLLLLFTVHLVWTFYYTCLWLSLLVRIFSSTTFIFYSCIFY